MKALILNRYGGKLIYGESPLPKILDNNEVLVKMKFSPINPADIYFTKGMYGILKKLPVVAGMEGVGTIEQFSDELKGICKPGTKVAILCTKQGDGTWAQFCKTTLDRCLILDDDIDLRQGACAMVNPLTAIGMIEEVQAKNVDCVIQTAASSAVAKMFYRLCKTESIRCINIVRKPEQVELLKQEEADIVLNSTSDQFDAELRAAITKFKPKIMFDAVAGEITAKILPLMPRESTCYIYGSLSHAYMAGINPKDFIFEKKTIRGFYLEDFIEGKNLFKEDRLSQKVNNYLRKGLLTTVIHNEYQPQEVNEAIAYYLKNMSKGKILLNFS